MVWCKNCAKNIRPDRDGGKICCSLCGRVLDEDNFAEEPVFVKNAAGQSRVAGNYVKTIQNDYSASRERTLSEARYGIENMLHVLGIDGGDSITNPAMRFYRIALERNFTRGRRKELVEASCLYISCRQEKKPYLLIDFSEHLRTNVYVLGAVFLQLCQLLSLGEHPIIQKPVDPSLFIHRFTDRLFGCRKPGVSKTALQIITSMKRDWMQTGRKPSGICGAALYISALAHGLKCSKSDVMKVVHVCDATLTKRLIEFENTESGGLTIDEFKAKADELEKEERLITSRNTGSKASGTNELLCQHKGSGKSHFALGLCESCYKDFIELSGGLNGGSEPPAFERAEMERIMAKEAALQRSKLINSDEQRGTTKTSESEVLESAKSDSTRATEQHKVTYDPMVEESENLSDIDDDEIKNILLGQEEIEFKTIIWEGLNKEYIQEEAAKEAAAMAAKKALQANLAKCSGDVEAAQKLAAAAAEAVSKSRKEKRRKRAEELRNLGPAQTAHEATKQVLDRKGLSSKIDPDALKRLLEPENPSSDAKKQRIEPESDRNDDDYAKNSKDDPEIDDNQDMDLGYLDEYNYEEESEEDLGFM